MQLWSQYHNLTSTINHLLWHNPNTEHCMEETTTNSYTLSVLILDFSPILKSQPPPYLKCFNKTTEQRWYILEWSQKMHFSLSFCLAASTVVRIWMSSLCLDELHKNSKHRHPKNIPACVCACVGMFATCAATCLLKSDVSFQACGWKQIKASDCQLKQ